MQALPTRAHLMHRWPDVLSAARSLSMLPEGQGGPLSHALASLAGRLRVSHDACSLLRACCSAASRLTASGEYRLFMTIVITACSLEGLVLGPSSSRQQESMQC